MRLMTVTALKWAEKKRKLIPFISNWVLSLSNLRTQRKPGYAELALQYTHHDLWPQSQVWLQASLESTDPLLMTQYCKNSSHPLKTEAQKRDKGSFGSFYWSPSAQDVEMIEKVSAFPISNNTGDYKSRNHLDQTGKGANRRHSSIEKKVQLGASNTEVTEKPK